jgi:hypothetical protein
MHEAHVITALVDTLIPGDDVFPKASTVGTQYWLLDKIRLVAGNEIIDRVVQSLGEDFTVLDEARRTSVVARFENQQPILFSLVRQLVYFGYYQSPLVVRAVRALGLVYNDAPQPLGYDLGHFDPSLHLPAQPRGHYIATDQVERVDLSGITLDTAGQP